jgi:UDP-N-acetylmuramoyl-tripeptide--D-alanyl-D-alanine ligase
MKKLAKKSVAAVLGWQVRRLRKKNVLKIVGVTGSIGKTSSKFAITAILKQQFKVQSQAGNYNDVVSVPLIFFGQKLPNIFNPLAWLITFWRNERIIRRPYPYEIVVVELGTDAPGQVEQFSRYIELDIGVLTAITPEHMEFFSDLAAVAEEELAITKFSRQLFVNTDLCDPKFLAGLETRPVTYGIKEPANVRIVDINFQEFTASFAVEAAGREILKVTRESVTEPMLYSICAAVGVGHQMGMAPEAIIKGVDGIKPVNGRMQLLRGVNNSLIIDDTYNASPEAMRSALDTLYRIKAPQRIAILGNMNELGKYSESEHRQVGQYCDPKNLDMVITIGPDANKYLAAEARGRGCAVKEFTSPFQAGEYLKALVKPGALILAKGSQNSVFAEETVKILLANQADSDKLVRQTKDWLQKKQKAFA